jgi:hypothetical protein
MMLDEYAAQLLETGVVVIPMDPEVYATLRDGFEAYLATIPEHLPGMKEQIFEQHGPGILRRIAAGGFGALGVASAFHALVFRANRKHQQGLITPLLARVHAGSDAPLHLQVIPDRAAFRPKGDKCTAESVHRDLSSGLRHKDTCYGSWCNLNHTGDQHFSCMLGTAIEVDAGQTGYTAVIDRDIKREFKAHKTRVCCPPGHVILFRESLLHEVLGTPSQTDTYRIFTGFNVSSHLAMLYPQNLQRCGDQEQLQYKGGDFPRLVPRLWLVNWADRWKVFSQRFIRHPALIYNHTVQSSGVVHNDVCRVVAPSLATLGLKYPDYSAVDLAVLQPQPLQHRRGKCGRCPKPIDDDSTYVSFVSNSAYCDPCMEISIKQVASTIRTTVEGGPAVPGAGASKVHYEAWLAHQPWLTAEWLDKELKRRGFTPAKHERGVALEMGVHGAYKRLMVDDVWVGELVLELLLC